MLFYLILNWVFLRTVPLDQLQGIVEVGALSARTIFGPRGGVLMAALLCLLLLSTVSGMILAGPRILQVIGEDTPMLSFLAVRSRRGAPVGAVLLQQAIALVFIATGSFEGVLTFAGYTLTLFALLTVFGVVVLRHREPKLERPFRVPAYPWPPLVFVLVSVLTLVLVLRERPMAAAASLGIVALGLLLAWTHGGTKPPNSST
jgi:APA family basic amino acid/polyamine antiporter